MYVPSLVADTRHMKILRGRGVHYGNFGSLLDKVPVPLGDLLVPKLPSFLASLDSITGTASSFLKCVNTESEFSKCIWYFFPGDEI